MSLIDYSKITLFSAIQKLPSKWLDWMRIVIIIGAFSIFEEEYPNIYLSMIIVASYVAVFFDSCIFIYNFYYDTISKPTYTVLDDQRSDFLKLSEDTLKLSEDTIKQAENTLNESEDIIEQAEEFIEGHTSSEKLQPSKIEDLQKKKEGYQKSLEDVKKYKEDLEKHNINIKKILDNKQEFTYRFKKELLVVGLITAILLTFSLIGLINYLVNIYIEVNSS